jgi:glycosyltransferase involved in cell wall biosynthesis
MPRIVHVISTPSGVGGAERVVAGLMTATLKSGWQTHLLNPFVREDPPALASLVPDGCYEGFPVSGIRELPAARKWLGARLRELKADVVHAHLFHASALTAFTPATRDMHRIATHHHGDVLAWKKRRASLFIDRHAIKRYEVVVAVSEQVAGFLTGVYGVPRKKVVVIRNGWEGTPLVRRAPITPTVLSIGNLRPEKGHAVLLDAFAQVHEELLEARLTIVGEGPLRERLQDHTRALGLEGQVDFLGAQSDVWPFLSSATVLAQASHSEPLGIVVLEGMAAGLPVVATEVGGVPELVVPGVTGVLVPPGDPSRLAEELVKLLKDPSTAARMGAAGKRRAADLRWEVMIDSYLGLYGSISRGDKF